MSDQIITVPEAARAADRDVHVLVLAAGAGTRMRSELPKVLHQVCGSSMIRRVLTVAQTLTTNDINIVVGHAREQVIAHVSDWVPAPHPIVQHEQRGTGHAVRTALEQLPELTGTLIVLPGDHPLLAAATLHELLDVHRRSSAATTLLTAVMDDATGYGRVLRDEHGQVARIVEHKDANDQQRQVREVNTSIYAFDVNALRTAVGRLTDDNAQGELYLTDVVELNRRDGRHVASLTVADSREVLGVNSVEQLAEAEAALAARA